MGRELQVVNRNRRLAEWSGRVEACRDSGQTVSQWCGESGVAVSTYYAWQRKVFYAVTAKAEACFVEIPTYSAAPAVSRALVIHAGELEIELCPGADTATIGAHHPGIEIMLNDFNCVCPVYIACRYTDLRRGIDGLAGIE